MELYPISNGWSAAPLVAEGADAMSVDASTPEIASRRAVATVAAATPGNVRIAHGGLLDRATVDRLGADDADRH